MLADRRGDVTAQFQAVLDHAVRVVEELHPLDPDHAGAGDLLPLAHHLGLLRGHVVDAGLSSGGQQVRHLAPLGRPSGDGSGAAVLHVVGMSHHRQRPPPVLGHRQ